ncbi:MAG: hypothetical protein U1E27_04530, partial [Kiritimatiellia bacterium]|nr:hypothetical protein [Kiritimatiellia bacterium]
SDAAKQTGTLVVTCERGLRLNVLERDGAAEINPREMGIRQPGTWSFRLLRPAWALRFQTETLSPLVKAETVHRFDISEGRIALRAFIRYDLEQAGLKVFRLRAPRPGVPLTVSGRQIARVHEAYPVQGIWEVELQGKVEREYALEVGCLLPVAPGQTMAALSGIAALDAEPQRDSIVLLADPRLSLETTNLPDDLRVEDPRAIPARLGAGDLAAAARSYRATRPGWAFDLAFTRHALAEQPTGRVESARLISVLSEDGGMITQVTLRIAPEDLLFLETRLPAGCDVWAAFVNDKPVTPLKKEEAHLFSLTRDETGKARVELILFQEAGVDFRNRRFLEGPRFAVPMADVEWEVYAPARYRYSSFEGTLPFIRLDADGMAFDSERYSSLNIQRVQQQAQKARTVLEQGAKLFDQGRQQDALRAMEQ